MENIPPNDKPQIINYSETDLTPQNTPPASSFPPPATPAPVAPSSSNERNKKIYRFLKWPIIVVLPLFFIVAGTVWGMNTYDHYYKIIPIEDIVPADTNLVLRISASPDSKQFQLLEKNLQKFPGYETLKKKLDKTGEGKSLSQVLQDKLKESNLDFQEDIKPVLGDHIFVFVPDLSPFGQEIKTHLSFLGNEAKQFTDKDPLALAGPKSAADGSRPEVLGDSTELNYIPASESLPQPMDFITAAEIKDLNKAKQVLDKMKTGDKFETIKHDFSGYQYFEVKPKTADASTQEGGMGTLFRSGKTFHAILGGNWFMASSEDLIKRLISSRVQNNLLSKISFGKKSTIPVLSQDTDFKKTYADFSSSSQDNLLTAYVKIDMQNFFKNKCPSGNDCGSDVTESIKFPPNYISGGSIQLSDDGISFKTFSNKMTLDKFKSVPFKDGIASLVAEKIDSRWLDVFLEAEDVKSAYYSFKRNNLTEQGLKTWNEGLQEVSDRFSINAEKDIIDQFDGNVALAVFTKPGDIPEEALIAEIKDPQAIAGTIAKIVEKYKQMSAENISAFSIPNQGSPCKSARTDSEKRMCAMETKFAEQQKALAESKITETDDPGGKIYSYRPGPDAPFSFDFGFAGNKLILASHFAAVQGLMQKMASGSQDRLSQNKFYTDMAGQLNNQSGSAKTFVNTAGIWNIVSYYYGQMLSDYGGDQPDKSGFESIGAILKTVKLLGSTTYYENDLQHSNEYLKIVELPRDEKARAEEAISKLGDQISGAKSKAKIAAFRASASSVFPSALVCDDNNTKLNTTNPGPGKNICSDANAESSTYPQMADGVCDGNTYTVEATDATAADGLFTYKTSCMVAGEMQSITCDQEGCTH